LQTTAGKASPEVLHSGMSLKRRWLAFCRRAGAKPGREAGAAGQAVEEAFCDLDRRYRESGRHYHTWAHVAACLRELRRARRAAAAADQAKAGALELALWFHDAVYEPGREDNEELSAALAVRWVSALGLAPAVGERAAGLILATRHLPPGPPRADPAEALMRDIDLAVLGVCWQKYLRYERGIAREYALLPPESFREGRAGLLRGFLARPELYSTPDFRRRLERRARRNLARALVQLEAGRLTRRAPGRPSGPGARPGS
jgi:predicted metal-dependent HD superfamily phosphohydrolase